jgi:taurine--2-oxoglutarate transaminase
MSIQSRWRSRRASYFWTPEGKRYIDFNSQLMCVNIGHSDPRVIKAIQDQAATLAYAIHSWRRSARQAGAEAGIDLSGDIDVFFFTNGGAEANENAIASRGCQRTSTRS